MPCVFTGDFAGPDRTACLPVRVRHPEHARCGDDADNDRHSLVPEPVPSGSICDTLAASIYPAAGWPDHHTDRVGCNRYCSLRAHWYMEWLSARWIDTAFIKLNNLILGATHFGNLSNA